MKSLSYRAAIFVLACLSTVANTLAQESRVAPILEVNTDARSRAMGNVQLTQTDRNYLYVNPTALLYSGRYMAADAALQAYPKADGIGGRLMYYNANVAYRLGSRHAVFAGYRYLGGEKYTRMDDAGIPGKALKPFEWSVDAGYAFRIDPAWSVFATGSFVYSHQGRTARTAVFSIGGAFRKEVSLKFAQQSTLGIALRIADLGAKLNYGRDRKWHMPSSVALTGDVVSSINADHSAAANIGTRYYFSPSGAKQFFMGLGGEYTYRSFVSARAGFEYGSSKASALTCGIGVRPYKRIHVDMAYRHALADHGMSTLLLNVGIAFN